MGCRWIHGGPCPLLSKVKSCRHAEGPYAKARLDRRHLPRYHLGRKVGAITVQTPGGQPIRFDLSTRRWECSLCRGWVMIAWSSALSLFGRGGGYGPMSPLRPFFQIPEDHTSGA